MMTSTLTSKHRAELAENGYSVVKEVLSEEECQLYIQDYIDWVESNFPPGVFPHCKNSIIQRYSIGHLAPSWSVRLKAKPVFEELWGTKELLSSIDAVAIGRPPEQGEEEFHSNDKLWLHLDQGAGREGLHAYQGAVYLESANMDDWVFECMEGSHQAFQKFWKEHPQERATSIAAGDSFRLDESHVKWFREQGCLRRRIAVPKGGLLLWDSRLVHNNVRPIKERSHSERWRFVVLVCMGPAAWADRASLRIKKKAYRDLRMTSHWPCTGVRLLPAGLPGKAPRPKQPLRKLPEVAKSLEAMQLAGILPYKRTNNNNNKKLQGKVSLSDEAIFTEKDTERDGHAAPERLKGPPPAPLFTSDYVPPMNTEDTLDYGWILLAVISALICVISIYVFVYVINAGE